MLKVTQPESDGLNLSEFLANLTSDLSQGARGEAWPRGQRLAPSDFTSGVENDSVCLPPRGTAPRAVPSPVPLGPPGQPPRARAKQGAVPAPRLPWSGRVTLLPLPEDIPLFAQNVSRPALAP